MLGFALQVALSQVAIACTTNFTLSPLSCPEPGTQSFRHHRVGTRRKSCFSPLFQCPFLRFSFSFLFALPCPNKVFITRPAKSPLEAFSSPRKTLCLRFPPASATMACGFFSFWFLGYFFCVRILQIIGLVSLRVQCLLANFFPSLSASCILPPL